MGVGRPKIMSLCVILLLLRGSKQLMYANPIVARSPGGAAYEREVVPPDWVLDYWHPLEKAQYPDYFKCREQRKLEYIKWWDKTYNQTCK